MRPALVATVVGTIVLAACGGSPTADAPVEPAPSQAPSGEVPPEFAVLGERVIPVGDPVRTTVGAEGTRIDLPQAATIVVPAGAFAGPVGLTVESVELGEGEAEGGGIAVSTDVDVEALALPVQLVVPIDPAVTAMAMFTDGSWELFDADPAGEVVVEIHGFSSIAFGWLHCPTDPINCFSAHERENAFRDAGDQPTRSDCVRILQTRLRWGELFASAWCAGLEQGDHDWIKHVVAATRDDMASISRPVPVIVEASNVLQDCLIAQLEALPVDARTAGREDALNACDDPIFYPDPAPPTGPLALVFSAGPVGTVTRAEDKLTTGGQEYVERDYEISVGLTWSGLAGEGQLECSASRTPTQTASASAPDGSATFVFTVLAWQFEDPPSVRCSLTGPDGETVGVSERAE